MLRGGAPADRLLGLGGDDFLDGRAGRDTLSGGPGNDRIAAQDHAADRIACGPGRDIVNADPADRVARDCEVVSRQLSRDPYTNAQSQHETEVEPDSFSFGSTVVATFQVGRIFNGGAANIGFATSRDGGRTWRNGLLPGLTALSSPAGGFERASDPAVAYDAVHAVWLITSLLLNPGSGSALVISRSADGVTWSQPVTARDAPSDGPLLLDKQWLACDNGAQSPYHGNCYLSYSDFTTRSLVTQTSTDGGSTWSAAVAPPDFAGRSSVLGRAAPGPQILTQPNGDVVIAYYDEEQMSAVRSIDGGRTFSTTILVSPTRSAGLGLIRAAPLPSAENDAAGNMYLVWSDCGVRSSCTANDLVLSRSRDGVHWTAPVRIPAGPADVGYETPGLVVDPAGTGRLGLTYYSLGLSGIDAWFVASGNGGATWTRPQRLSAERMSNAWLAQTSAGPMLGDYISTSFAGGAAVPVFALAARPFGRRLNEGIFATRLSVP